MSNKNRKKWKADLITWLNENVLSDNPETLGCFKKTPFYGSLFNHTNALIFHVHSMIFFCLWKEVKTNQFGILVLMKQSSVLHQMDCMEAIVGFISDFTF